MPEHERAVVRKFLFGGFEGLNEQHDRRWRSFWGDAARAEVGEVIDVQYTRERSGQFHRRCMGIEQTLFDRQECWATIKAMRDWLKSGAGWGDYQLNPRGVMKFVPRSRSYEECSDLEMREIHAGILAFLRTPYAQKKLWANVIYFAATLASIMATCFIKSTTRDE